jgi:capsular polysaccharide biosynthesis protein
MSTADPAATTGAEPTQPVPRRITRRAGRFAAGSQRTDDEADSDIILVSPADPTEETQRPAYEALPRPPSRTHTPPGSGVDRNRGSRPRPGVSAILLAVLVVVVATAAAWWAGTRGPTVYGAEAELLVEVDAQNDPSADRRLSTQLVVLEGTNVLGPAATELGLSLRELRRALDASVIRGSQVIRIEASAQSPERATEIVEAVTKEYLAQPPDPVAEEAREYLNRQLEAASAERESLREELAAITPPEGPAELAEAAELQAMVDRQVQRVSALQDQVIENELEQIRLGEPRVVTSPRALEEPLAPTPLRSAALGLLAGLVLAAVVIVAAVRRSALSSGS